LYTRGRDETNAHPNGHPVAWHVCHRSCAGQLADQREPTRPKLRCLPRLIPLCRPPGDVAATGISQRLDARRNVDALTIDVVTVNNDVTNVDAVRREHILLSLIAEYDCTFRDGKSRSFGSRVYDRIGAFMV
jgi:hypothetical protein